MELKVGIEKLQKNGISGNWFLGRNSQYTKRVEPQIRKHIEQPSNDSLFLLNDALRGWQVHKPRLSPAERSQFDTNAAAVEQYLEDQEENLLKVAPWIKDSKEAFALRAEQAVKDPFEILKVAKAQSAGGWSAYQAPPQNNILIPDFASRLMACNTSGEREAQIRTNLQGQKNRKNTFQLYMLASLTNMTEAAVETKWQKAEDVHQQILETYENIKSIPGFGTVVELFENSAGDLAEELLGGLRDLLKGILKVLQNILKVCQDIFAAASAPLAWLDWKAVGSEVNVVRNAMRTVTISAGIHSLYAALEDLVKAAVGALKVWFTSEVGPILQLAKRAGGDILKTARSFAARLPEVFQQHFTTLKEWIYAKASSLASRIKNATIERVRGFYCKKLNESIGQMITAGDVDKAGVIMYPELAAHLIQTMSTNNLLLWARDPKFTSAAEIRAFETQNWEKVAKMKAYASEIKKGSPIKIIAPSQVLVPSPPPSSVSIPRIAFNIPKPTEPQLDKTKYTPLPLPKFIAKQYDDVSKTIVARKTTYLHSRLYEKGNTSRQGNQVILHKEYIKSTSVNISRTLFMPSHDNRSSKTKDIDNAVERYCAMWKTRRPFSDIKPLSSACDAIVIAIDAWEQAHSKSYQFSGRRQAIKTLGRAAEYEQNELKLDDRLTKIEVENSEARDNSLKAEHQAEHAKQEAGVSKWNTTQETQHNATMKDKNDREHTQYLKDLRSWEEKKELNDVINGERQVQADHEAYVAWLAKPNEYVIDANSAAPRTAMR